MVTWPSPAMATLPSLCTATMVVERIKPLIIAKDPTSLTLSLAKESPPPIIYPKLKLRRLGLLRPPPAHNVQLHQHFLGFTLRKMRPMIRVLHDLFNALHLQPAALRDWQFF